MNLIGGVIGYEDKPYGGPAPNKQKLWDKDESLFFVNARSALKYLLDQLEPPAIWLPSYLCPEIFKALSATSARVRFFPVGKTLLCESIAWCRQIEKRDAVIMIHYFGISWDCNLAQECKKRGAVLIKDASQALYSALPEFWPNSGADYCVFSPRKEIGVSDGGILVALKDKLPTPTLRPPSPNWIARADSACIGRSAFDQGSDDRSWFAAYQEAEAAAPTGPYSMSQKSRAILDTTDYRAQAAKRRENYEALLARLGDFALLSTLRENEIPSGFPVRVPLRDVVRKKLFSVDIFPPTHWNFEAIVPEDFTASHSLSSEILTLPCDHRYEIKDMIRLALAFRNAALSVVTLRPLEMSDLHRIHGWHNSRDLYRHLVGEFFGPTLEQTRAWLQKEIQPGCLQASLAICAGDDGQHVGNFYLRKIDADKKEAELHIFIGDVCRRGKGLGTATVRAGLDYAWRNLNLERVYLAVLSDNLPAIRIYERLGFTHEKTLERHVKKEGVVKDVLLMGIACRRNQEALSLPVTGGEAFSVSSAGDS